MDHSRAIATALLLLVATVSVGAAAYHIVEDWTWLESFYMVVITLSTVGFKEVRELSDAGRFVTMGVILFGLLSVTFLGAGITRVILEGEIRRVMGKRRMERDIAGLRDHYIVCGYGRVGRVVCHELAEEGVSLVVVDSGEPMRQRIEADGHLVVPGDATEEVTLKEAGIERAKGLILALPSEADNVYVTLLGKDLCPGLFVIARGISDNGERRLMAAGADRVVSPNIIGAYRIAQSVLRPSVLEFVDIVTGQRELEELQLDELRVSGNSQLVGRTLKECDIRRKYGLMVVGIFEPDGKISFNPSPRARVEAGLTLLVLGHREQLDDFAKAV